VLHDIRWTSRRIQRGLSLIEPLVYRRRQWLPCFRYLKLESPLANPPVLPGIDDRDWESIPWGTYWSEFNADFVLRTSFRVPFRTSFRVPSDWGTDSAIALYLPIGKAGDFSHPEALAYIDGRPHAACDRHHQEIAVPPRFCDGEPHLLALHGWVGSLRDDRQARLLMRTCALVQRWPALLWALPITWMKTILPAATCTPPWLRHLTSWIPVRRPLRGRAGMHAIQTATQTTNRTTNRTASRTASIPARQPARPITSPSATASTPACRLPTPSCARAPARQALHWM